MCSGDPTLYLWSTDQGCVLMNTFIALLLVDGMHLSCAAATVTIIWWLSRTAAMQDLPLVDSGLHEESVSLPGTPTTCTCTVQPNCLTLL